MKNAYFYAFHVFIHLQTDWVIAVKFTMSRVVNHGSMTTRMTTKTKLIHSLLLPLYILLPFSYLSRTSLNAWLSINHLLYTFTTFILVDHLRSFVSYFFFLLLYFFDLLFCFRSLYLLEFWLACFSSFCLMLCFSYLLILCSFFFFYLHVCSVR